MEVNYPLKRHTFNFETSKVQTVQTAHQRLRRYKIQLIQELTPTDPEQRGNFAQWICTQQRGLT